MLTPLQYRCQSCKDLRTATPAEIEARRSALVPFAATDSEAADVLTAAPAVIVESIEFCPLCESLEAIN